MKHERTIVQLNAENIKRLTAVEIKPEPHGLVIIGGNNSNGKSSVLDSIMFALAGGRSIPPKPIHDGAESGEVTLDLGDLKVVRRFTASGSTVRVESNGAVYKSPQALLDRMCELVAFDPLEFSKLPQAQQAERLARLVGLDTAAIDQQIAAAIEDRKLCKREAERARVALNSEFPNQCEATGEHPVKSVAELTSELTEAKRQVDLGEQHDREVAANVEAIANCESEIETDSEELAALDEERKAAEEQAQRITEDERERASARHAAELAAMKERHAAELETIDRNLRIARESIETRAKSRKERLASDIERHRGRLAELVETRRVLSERAFPATRPVDVIQTELKAAEVLGQFAKAKLSVDIAEKRLEGAEADLEKLRTSRREMVNALRFPVDGLTIDENGEIWFKGQPFVQASQSERIRVSVAVGLASNPELRVFLIREGGLLDDDAMRELAVIAADSNAQIWVERIGDKDPAAIVIEDGHVRGVEPVQASEPADKPKRKRKGQAEQESNGVSLAEMAKEPGNS